jgi:hypothetical protein
MRRCLVLLALSACFGDPPGTDSEGSISSTTMTAGSSDTGSTSAATSGATTSSMTATATGTADGSTGGDACESGYVSVPYEVPDGWDRWALFAEGMPMQPPIPCLDGMPDVAFLNAMPRCSCACADNISCHPAFVPYDDSGCGGITGMGGLIMGCTGLIGGSTALSLTDGASPAGSCDATPTALPGPDAVPVSLCGVDLDDGCVPLPIGFEGPCLVGPAALPCPGELVDHLQPIEFTCGGCETCPLLAACSARQYDLFDAGGCTGTSTIALADNSCTMGDFHSIQRAAPDPLADTGCPDATAGIANRRICCVP